MLRRDASCQEEVRARSAPGQKTRRRKYIALVIKDEVLIQAVAKDKERKGFRLVEAVFNFGAEDSVAPPRVFSDPIVLLAMSKAGGRYREADGYRVPNIGQPAVCFRTHEGIAAGFFFQTAEIERPLISASQLATSGNRVLFSAAGTKIINETTGKRTALRKRGGIDVLRMWIPLNPKEFIGQGR